MKRFGLVIVTLLMIAGCMSGQSDQSSDFLGGDGKTKLLDARRGFATKLTRKESAHEPVPAPPPNLFRVVRYDAPPGKLAAYLSVAPKDSKRHPAIIWITGGDCNTIGDVWAKRRPQNDQTASAFREAGIPTMFPSLRGGNDNPGIKEGFLGEVDDVLAAADFLALQDFVDPQRIYLGGHSTGGTLVFLVAAASERFRGVFSFGPVHDVRGYPPEYTPWDTSKLKEAVLRSPGPWLPSVQSPLYVFEGTDRGNIESLKAMASVSKNPKIHFYSVSGATHFSLLQPVTRLLAGKILHDDGPTTNIMISDEELRRAIGR